MVQLDHRHMHARRVAEMAVGLVTANTTNTTTSGTALPTSANSSWIYLFSHGLNGVEQSGNDLWTRVLAATFGALCVVTLLARLWMRANNHLRHMSSLGAGSRQAYWLHEHTKWWPALKKHLLYAPLWRNRHNREFQLSEAVTIGTLPSRYHMLLLLSYFVLNLVYMFLIKWDRADMPATLAALRGRSGALAALNLIPTILFALRGNPLIRLLHVSYDTFNLLHRWFARMVVFEAVVHSLCWFINTVRAAHWSGTWYMLQETPSYQWGLVGTCLFVLIIVQAWSPVRHAFYETFLTAHRILVFVGILGVYVHIDTHRLPQLPWIQVGIAMWALEWAWRTYKIIYYNIGTRQTTNVKVEAMPGEACRVTCTLVRPWGSVKPGSHVHIYLPGIEWGSSHPFSVAWSDIDTSTGNLSLEEKLDLPTTESSSLRLESQSHTSISLIIRARTGMTRKLYDKASSQTNGILTTKGLIEGPYGGHESFRSYGTAILFAAGVGITHQVSQVRTLVAGFSEGSIATRRIVLVWSVPNTETLEWVRPWMDEILKMPGRRDCLRIQLFITKPRSHAEIISSGTGTVQMFPGRCNPATVLEKELQERVGATAVTVCGPGAFADSVRSAVRARMGDKVVDFVEEAFTY